MNLNDQIATIMTRNVVTVFPETPALEIRNLFWESNFHHVPVVDSEGMLKGIISSVDFIKMEKWKEEKKWDVRELRAKDLMTKYPFSLAPEDSIARAVELFQANKFHALPIVEDGELMGILTTHDILNLMMKAPHMEED